jgi:hypothetical protein
MALVAAKILLIRVGYAWATVFKRFTYDRHSCCTPNVHFNLLLETGSIGVKCRLVASRASMRADTQMDGGCPDNLRKSLARRLCNAGHERSLSEPADSKRSLGFR